MSDNGKSATDIITYIGVPLAVLGVLPILYNTFATLVSLSRIRGMLRRSRLTALTRSDVVNRVIEIELPRYAVMPLDRFQDRSEYWALCRHPSSIPGGSWTTFNWKTNAIGIKTQRVEYADQVRQPQVEVAFDDLVCYLLDLGALPDPHGWKLLRSTGLWTPVGCCLMMSPDRREKALTVAPLDDSDGNLSLAVAWSSSWITRDYAHLPPYWIRLPAPPKKPLKEGSGESSSTIEEKDMLSSEEAFCNGEGSGKREGSEDAGSIERECSSNCRKAITCQISMSGLVTALTQDDHLQSTINFDSLYIDHVRVRPGRTNGIWFASMATAYGTTNQTILWNYKIPEDILAFARKETVPCGVMVLLNLADESETPEWATSYNDHGAHLDQFARRSQEQRAAMQAEARMTPAQREQASRDRMRREMDQRMQDMRDKVRLDQQRREQRMMEALQSPKWDSRLVAERTLKWLQAQGFWDKSLTLKEVVGFMLHQMIRDGEFTSSICRMLDTWKAWADMGGMKRADYQTIQDGKSTFAHATLLIALIKDTSMALDGTLSMDLQECLRMWRNVRLG
ncbi:Fc.00g105680.m01.CDS01 [Cosmosporella sp. VM-42]